MMMVDNGLARCRLRVTGFFLLRGLLGGLGILCILRILRRTLALGLLSALSSLCLLTLTILLGLASNFLTELLLTLVSSLLGVFLEFPDALNDRTSHQHGDEDKEEENK